jgi:hypothetical protein
MCFHIDDEVIPVVYSTKNGSEPLSVLSDGTPKVFKVVSVERISRGVSKQVITIQEK